MNWHAWSPAERDVLRCLPLLFADYPVTITLSMAHVLAWTVLTSLKKKTQQQLRTKESHRVYVSDCMSADQGVRTSVAVTVLLHTFRGQAIPTTYQNTTTSGCTEVVAVAIKSTSILPNVLLFQTLIVCKRKLTQTANALSQNSDHCMDWPHIAASLTRHPL